MGDTISNPNNPASYTPSSGVQAVAPMLAQITGGDKGNTLAAIQGAQNSDNGFFGNIGSIVAQTTAQLSAVFAAGKAAGTNPSALAGNASDAGAIAGKATFDAGVAGANIAGMTELAKAAAAAQDKANAVAMGMDPNGPTMSAQIAAVGESSAKSAAERKSIADMQQTGFFDNPAAYLINHIINIPLAEGRAEDAEANVRGVIGNIAEQTKGLTNLSVVDQAMNSTDTVNKAAEMYKQALGIATAAGIDPLMKAQQIQISAGDLGANQANAATNAGRLAIEKLKLPGELAQQKATLASTVAGTAKEQALLPGQLTQQQAVGDYYGAAHDAVIDELRQKAALQLTEMQAKVKKDAQDTEVLGQVNNVYKYFGGEGTVTNIDRLPGPRRDALMTMASNLNQFGGVAGDPLTARDLIVRSGIDTNNMPAGHLRTLNGIDDIATNALANLQNPATHLGQKPLEGPALENQLRVNTRADIMREQNDITPQNKIFTLPSATQIVGMDQYKNNPVVQALRPLTIDGNGTTVNRPLDGSMLLNTAAQLVSDKKISEAQAVSALQDIGHGILQDLNTTGGLNIRFGIPIQPKFPLSFSKSGFGLGNRIDHVDLYNSADILTKLRSQMGGNAVQGMEKNLLAGSAAISASPGTALSIDAVNKLRDNLPASGSAPDSISPALQKLRDSATGAARKWLDGVLK